MIQKFNLKKNNKFPIKEANREGGGTSARQNSGCEISGEGGTSADSCLIGVSADSCPAGYLIEGVINTIYNLLHHILG